MRIENKSFLKGQPQNAKRAAFSSHPAQLLPTPGIWTCRVLCGVSENKPATVNLSVSVTMSV
jgi:hypothetical protein